MAHMPHLVGAWTISTGVLSWAGGRVHAVWQCQ